MNNHPKPQERRSRRKKAGESVDYFSTGVSLEPRLLELVRLRVAQICNCQPGMDVHMEALKAQGESDERIEQLKSWRESPLYKERERAALAMSEALGSDPSGPVSAEVVHRARGHFTNAGMIQLTLTIFAVSDWSYQAVS